MPTIDRGGRCDKGTMNLVVWHENQRTPASVYGDANFGKGCYSITVRPEDAAKFVDQLKAKGEKALVYNFTSSNGGGGG